jgi:hypothetical protein
MSAFVTVSGHHWVEGNQVLAVEAGARALAAAEELDDWELRGLAHYRIGQAWLFLGAHATAAEHLRKGIAALDHEEGRALFRFGGLLLIFITSFLAWTLAEMGEFAESEAVGVMGFKLTIRANHAYSISCASFGPARGYILQGRFADAILNRPLLAR